MIHLIAHKLLYSCNVCLEEIDFKSSKFSNNLFMQPQIHFDRWFSLNWVITIASCLSLHFQKDLVQ
jgi:hypothetical protein